MFVFTAKLTRKKLAAAVGGAGIVLIAVILLLSGRGRVEASGTAPTSVKNIKTNEARVDFLAAYGWEVTPEADSVQEVLIPKEFDSMFEEYNAMQTAQGFDLSKYRGKRVMRYVYKVENHPGGSREVYATLLMHKNTVIGGDIQSPELDGFIHGFER